MLEKSALARSQHSIPVQHGHNACCSLAAACQRQQSLPKQTATDEIRKHTETNTIRTKVGHHDPGTIPTSCADRQLVCANVTWLQMRTSVKTQSCCEAARDKKNPAESSSVGIDVRACRHKRSQREAHPLMNAQAYTTEADMHNVCCLHFPAIQSIQLFASEFTIFPSASACAIEHATVTPVCAIAPYIGLLWRRFAALELTTVP